MIYIVISFLPDFYRIWFFKVYATYSSREYSKLSGYSSVYLLKNSLWLFLIPHLCSAAESCALILPLASQSSVSRWLSLQQEQAEFLQLPAALLLIPTLCGSQCARGQKNVAKGGQGLELLPWTTSMLISLSSCV